MYKVILLTIITLLSTTACSTGTMEKEMIEIVYQPIVEVGKSVDFYVYFQKKPDSGSLKIEKINGFEAIDEDRFEEGWYTIQSEKNVYSYYTYVTFTEVGEIRLPQISATIDGVEFKSKPSVVSVVENMEVDESAVKLLLTTDKSSYRMRDTIKVSLYEYSQFFKTSQKMVIEENMSNDISMNGDLTLDMVAGIPHFNMFLNDHFEIKNLDYNMFDVCKEMAILDNKPYIKTLIFTIYLLPKEKGEFIFQPSKFDYKLYKSNTDYFGGLFALNETGTYTIMEREEKFFRISSDSLTVKIK